MQGLVDFVTAGRKAIDSRDSRHEVHTNAIQQTGRILRMHSNTASTGATARATFGACLRAM